jgi:YD repeat-containing protein
MEIQMMKHRSPHKFAVLAFALGLASALLAPSAHAANGSVIYTYDALGRVTTASYDTGVIVIYTYDANGNRTAQVININTSTLTWTATATPCTANCWGAALW